MKKVERLCEEGEWRGNSRSSNLDLDLGAPSARSGTEQVEPASVGAPGASQGKR